MFLLGLVGKKQAGKDTIYEIIRQHWPNKRIIRIAFADSLKEEVAQAIGQTVPYIDNHKQNFRLILQGWGTEFRRQLSDENYWVDKWIYKASAANADGIIATDVRFLNESKAIHDLGGLLWRVLRPNVITADSHASEMEQERIQCDETIFNDGTLSDLSLAVNIQLDKWNGI